MTRRLVAAVVLALTLAACSAANGGQDPGPYEDKQGCGEPSQGCDGQ